ncbi:hypothetical protein D3C87_2051520 [compost metagenome]
MLKMLSRDRLRYKLGELPDRNVTEIAKNQFVSDYIFANIANPNKKRRKMTWLTNLSCSLQV